MKDQKIKTMTTTAMFTAIITVLTACFQIKTVNDGYIHFGDSMIYLAACLLPAPYAIFAGSVGGAMADILSGSA
ncbi:MAG: ECF transporter S component, partial [Oscillospiraceae bacterium]|nr:ECF transporter S component [Oscillospiraceae bacterium]